jgi:hypothetical protein
VEPSESIGSAEASPQVLSVNPQSSGKISSLGVTPEQVV